MTHLRLAVGIEPIGVIGSADAEDAWYWHRSQIDSPPTDGIYRTDFNAESIDVYCRTPLVFVAWARHLGFDIHQNPTGQQLTNEAAGSVAHLRRSYAVRIHYTDFSDGGDAA